jgi:hypothetical protein
MEKFLLLIRQDEMNEGGRNVRLAHIPAMLEWVQSLSESGNYCGGSALTITGYCVGKDKTIMDHSYGEVTEGISGYDVILAENLNQAVSIAQTCPLVMNGVAKREVRLILPLPRPVKKQEA